MSAERTRTLQVRNADNSSHTCNHAFLSLFLSVFILTCIIIQFTSTARSEKQGEYLPLTLIMLTLDGLRHDHLGCYGYPVHVSPNIDLISKQSVLQTQAFSQSVSTKSALMTLLTSHYPEVHAINDLGGPQFKLTPKIQTLPEILAKLGFITAAFVSNKELPDQAGFRRGFDQYIIGDPFGRDNTVTYILDQRVIPYLENNIKARKPQFVLLHTDMLHFPPIPVQPYLDLFVKPGQGEFVRAIQQDTTFITASDQQRIELFWKVYDNLKPARSSLFSTLYDAQIRYLDETFGHLVRSIPTQHYYREVMLVLTAQHGDLLRDLRQFHDDCLLYDPLIQVPLIIRLPNNTMGGLVRENMVELTDVMPTVLELIGTKPLNGFQGTAQFQPSRLERDEGCIYSEVTFPNLVQSTVRTSQWKYIIDKKAGTECLFHLVTDPSEQDNLASQDRYQVIKQQFRNMLESKTGKNASLLENLRVNKKVEMSPKMKQ
ncbi:sulfatase-like hydrolase/transferase [bacterium]|nr:sulfatase-like hydrolase/transferase [bacterium]